MSDTTIIHWCDSTVNPIMGCHGCELFPGPKAVTAAIDKAVRAAGATIKSYELINALVNKYYAKIKKPRREFKNEVTTTHIWHLRSEIATEVLRSHGTKAAAAARKAIRMAITCYSAKLHTNKGLNILNPDKKGVPHAGHAPIFEQLTRYEGRTAGAAEWDDLLGQCNPKTPWKDGLPRMIFVSDMGDALCVKEDFPFLRDNVMKPITSVSGKRHLWLWLTKRPKIMADFAKLIGGFPDNVCAMTTVTSVGMLGRVDELRKVKAHCRGLSIEPLWERIPPAKLNLKGIDWVIVGGESGSGVDTRPFDLAWAEELRDHCKSKNVAFFMKQLGRNPVRDGKKFRHDVNRTVMPSGKFTDLIVNSHGSEWDEWPESLRIRQFPKYFHDYRAKEKNKIKTGTLRPAAGMTKAKKQEAADAAIQPSKKDEDDFKKYNDIVRRGVEAFIECGKALQVIQERRLWRAGGYSTWEDYCREVAGLSKSYALRIVQASTTAQEISAELPIGNSGEQVRPRTEYQIRSLQRLERMDQRVQAWKSAVDKSGGQPTAEVVTEAVFEILAPAKKPKKPGRSEIRAAIISQLRQVARARRAWDDVDRLSFELEKLETDL